MRISFVPEDIADPNVVVNMNKRFLVEHYRYQCRRSLDERGLPYGDTLPSTVELTIRVSDLQTCNSLYRYVEKDAPVGYSILFDVLDNQYSRKYDGISFRGYIVDINETFCSGNDGQMLFTLTILLNSIVYVSKDTIRQLPITH